MNAFQAQALSLGRNWATAKSAALTSFNNGDAIITLTWEDGAQVVQSYDSEREAVARLASLGFYKRP